MKNILFSRQCRKNLAKMLAVKIPKCSLNASMLTQRAIKVQDCRFTKFQKNIMWQIAMSNLGHDAHVSDFQFIFSNTFFHEFKTCWKMSLQSEIRQSSISYTGSLGRWDKWLIDQSSDVPSIIFFIISYRLRGIQNSLFLFFRVIKKKKIDWKNFCKEFCNKLWKKK